MFDGEKVSIVSGVGGTSLIDGVTALEVGADRGTQGGQRGASDKVDGREKWGSRVEVDRSNGREVRQRMTIDNIERIEQESVAVTVATSKHSKVANRRRAGDMDSMGGDHGESRVGEGVARWELVVEGRVYVGHALGRTNTFGYVEVMGAELGELSRAAKVAVEHVQGWGQRDVSVVRCVGVCVGGCLCLWVGVCG